MNDVDSSPKAGIAYIAYAGALQRKRKQEIRKLIFANDVCAALTR